MNSFSFCVAFLDQISACAKLVLAYRSFRCIFVRYFKTLPFILSVSEQPLTELHPPKCKSCGLYDADTFTEDDAFTEWELCPLDFKPAPDARLHFEKEGEFRATFVCLSCNPNRATFTSGSE